MSEQDLDAIEAEAIASLLAMATGATTWPARREAAETLLLHLRESRRITAAEQHNIGDLLSEFAAIFRENRADADPTER